MASSSGAPARSVSKKLSAEISECAADYAAALDEIGGKSLAELLLTDDEEPAAARALKKLKGEKAHEVRWIMGWFRGIADATKQDPVAILKAGRLTEKTAA